MSRVTSITITVGRLLVAVTALLLAIPAYAWEYSSTGATTEQIVQLRMAADFTKKWDNGLRLGLSEELRFNLMDNVSGTNAKSESADASYGASWRKSYTTIALGYSHPNAKYLKVDAGYTLRLFGNKGFTDPNEYIRHRVFFGVTGSLKTKYAKLYIRERVLCDMRTDSVNLQEQSQYAWFLRSRIGADFKVRTQPIKPYLYLELENTLNAPEYQQNNGHQFISQVRTQAGVTWRITKMSSLDFFYRFQYGYERDINITKKKGNIQLTEEKSFLHAIGITYNLDW